VPRTIPGGKVPENSKGSESIKEGWLPIRKEVPREGAPIRKGRINKMIHLKREPVPFNCVNCKGAESNVPFSRKDDPRNQKEVRTELLGTYWVFAWPHLVPWPHKVASLFCLPSGRDLWAIDEHGNLLIIENKTTHNSDDPFSGMPVSSVVIESQVEGWSKRLDAEKDFRRKYPNGPTREFPPPEKGLGLLDSSRGRYPCRLYPHIYREQIAPKIDNGEYEEHVRRYLELYKARMEPPHYFGLFTLFNDDEPKLKNRNNYDRLVADVGEEHVHMFAVRRSPECEFPHECQVCSYEVHPTEKMLS